jgi:hypothetical protein
LIFDTSVKTTWEESIMFLTNGDGTDIFYGLDQMAPKGLSTKGWSPACGYWEVVEPLVSEG